MELNRKPTKKNLEKVRLLYEAAFPKSEKKPWKTIIDKCNQGSMEIFSIEEDGSFLGLIITIKHSDILLLDYFAIDGARRGEGIGSKAISMLCEQNRNMRILLEIEDCEEENADNIEERNRRKSFYLRSGFSLMPYKVSLFGVNMNILTYGNAAVSFEEYHDIFVNVFSEKVAKKVKIY